MVVLAIMTILTTVFLFQQKKFDSSTLLRSLAYSVALSVRQAQVYGSSVRQFDTSANGFKYSYGLYFGTTQIVDSSHHYYLFADVNGDKVYTATPVDETVQKFTIGQGYTILRFCGILNSGDQSCTTGSTGVGQTIDSLSIFFKRPNPDAQFYSTVSGSASGETYCAVYIVLQGPGDDYRTVKVTTTGQIQIGSINTAVAGC
jgi:hypothetical protein